jgi:hypothetical protein
VREHHRHARALVYDLEINAVHVNVCHETIIRSLASACEHLDSHYFAAERALRLAGNRHAPYSASGDDLCRPVRAHAEKRAADQDESRLRVAH